MKLALFVLLSTVVSGSGCAGQFDAAAATGFQVIERKEGRYWAYVPNDAAQREQHGELLPLLVYLHDADARSDEPEQATQGALGKIIEQSHGQFPCVVLFPLLASKHRWNDPMELQRLDRIIDDALHRVGGDPDRVYLTGVGLGASGVWQLAASSPGHFAAIVPIAGSADAALAPAIGALPVWAFHGANDSTRPPTSLVGALGGTAKLTLLGGGHDIAARAYREPGLVEWLLAQKRATTAAAPAIPAPAGM